MLWGRLGYLLIFKSWWNSVKAGSFKYLVSLPILVCNSSYSCSCVIAILDEPFYVRFKAPSWLEGRTYHEKETSALNARRSLSTHIPSLNMYMKISSGAFPFYLLEGASLAHLSLSGDLSDYSIAPRHMDMGGTQGRNLLMVVIVPMVPTQPLDPKEVRAPTGPWREEAHSLTHIHVNTLL